LTAVGGGCYCGDTFRNLTMTATTTLKLPDALKARIVPLAEAAGKTPHAWMVDALEAQVALAEMREAFIAEAEASAAEVDAGGPLYAAEDVHAYIVARAAGKVIARPKPVRRGHRR
jgi:predicted transcriptional regulator